MIKSRKPILVLTALYNTPTEIIEETRQGLRRSLDNEYFILILKGEKESVELLSTRKMSKKKYITLLNLINKK